VKNILDRPTTAPAEPEGRQPKSRLRALATFAAMCAVTGTVGYVLAQHKTADVPASSYIGVYCSDAHPGFAAVEADVQSYTGQPVSASVVLRDGTELRTDTRDQYGWLVVDEIPSGQPMTTTVTAGGKVVSSQTDPAPTCLK